MEDKKENLKTINILMITVFVVIIIAMVIGFCYYKTGQPDVFLALYFIAFLWLNEILILLKLEHMSLRNRMVDPILVRKLVNIIIIVGVAILIIIVLLIIRVFFEPLLLCHYL